jgi:hypothetical protein
MGETLLRAQEALQCAETSDNASGSQHSADDEALYEFQAALSVAIESLSHALKPWPLILQQAHLSPEILELPSSNQDDEQPAQVIVFELILPPPVVTLTPIASRASGVQAPHLNNHRHDSDKPPAPFVYTPWTLFAKSQNMLIRSKYWNDVVKHLNAELHKSYPLVPTDLADEVAGRERRARAGDDPSKGFTDIPQIGGNWSSRAAARLERVQNGLIVDIDRRSTPGTMTSPTLNGTSEDLEEAKYGSGNSVTAFGKLAPPQTTPPSLGGGIDLTSGKGRRSRPGTANTETGLKKGFSALVSRGGAIREADEKKVPGPALYSGIRAKADG